jgi:class 3 adenylate cyclase
MVEFDDPLDATLCPIEIQRALHEHNNGVPKQREIRLRIVIHFEEVVRQQRDVLSRGRCFGF